MKLKRIYNPLATFIVLSLFLGHFCSQALGLEVVEIEGVANVSELNALFAKKDVESKSYTQLHDIANKTLEVKRKIALGEYFFSKTKDLKKSILYCGGVNKNIRQCSCGVLASYGKNQLLLSIAESTSSQFVSKYCRKGDKLCHHQLGHYLLEYKNGNLIEANKSCLNNSDFINPGFCISGVFSRWFVTHSSKDIDLNNFFQEPCLQTLGTSLGSCLKHKFDHKINELKKYRLSYDKFCTGYKELSVACHSAIGSELYAKFQKDKDIQKSEICPLGSESERWFCIRASMTTLLAEMTGKPQASQLCKGVSQNELGKRCIEFVKNFK